MTAEERFQKLLSEADGKELKEAGLYLAESQSVLTLVVRALGVFAVLMPDENFSRLGQVMAVAYLIGYDRAKQEVLEDLFHTQDQPSDP